MSEFEPYDPLAKRNLAASVAEALLEQKVRPLNNTPSFPGVGIYAIYYHGDEFAAYRKLAEANKGDDLRAPIYVGKAEGSTRKGAGGVELPSNALSRRLREHAGSVDTATNLNVASFSCRFLVVEDAWVRLAENLLIATFTPIWNTLIDGFGNHTPGRGRELGMGSRWDTLHPGRFPGLNFAARPETPAQIAAEVEAHLMSFVPPRSARLLANDK